MLGPTGVLLERYLDVLAARQRITASNIANADTPGYRSREIDFRNEMQSLLFQPRSAERPPAILVRESWDPPARNDGNNVNLDREMTALADNLVRFTVASLLLQKKARGLRSVIQEGR